MSYIDHYLNSITMYRLVLYGLGILALITIIFGFVNLLPYSGYQFLQLLFLLIFSSIVTQLLFTRIFSAIANTESFLITALILFFVLSPIQNIVDIYVTVAAAILAIGSKFIFAINRKHFFNPVAISIFILGLFGYGNGIWWVGSRILLPAVAVLGFLIVKKLRRFQLFFAFFLSAILTISLFNLRHGLTVISSLMQSVTSWPVIFFGTIMLTEPLTTPPSRKLSIVYGAITGILFGSQFNFGPIYSSPEFALIIGNIFSYLVSPKSKYILKYQSHIKLTSSIIEFSFNKPTRFKYLPGQYMEFTIPPSKTDARGNRRYFTLSSSPTEIDIKLGIKIPDHHISSFKKNIITDFTSGQIQAGQLSGDFILPTNPQDKLVFIAGGIGITPFRSMIKYLTDTQDKRQIILFYIASNQSEFVYQDIFNQAKTIGLKTIYIITNQTNVPKNWTGEIGYLDKSKVQKYVPDFSKRTFYLSGPNAMVKTYKQLLNSLEIPDSKIVTDYFPGF